MTDSVLTMNLTMDPYIEGMYATFKDYVPKRTVDTSCEPNLLLSLENESTVE